MQVNPTDKILCFLGFSPTGDLGALTGYTSKRGKPVWYLKAPPKTPPTGYQIHHRNVFRQTAAAWRALSDVERANWMEAARLARLHLTGFNLFVWYQIKGDTAVIQTIERHSGITLL